MPAPAAAAARRRPAAGLALVAAPLAAVAARCWSSASRWRHRAARRDARRPVGDAHRARRRRPTRRRAFALRDIPAAYLRIYQRPAAPTASAGSTSRRSARSRQTTAAGGARRPLGRELRRLLQPARCSSASSAPAADLGHLRRRRRRRRATTSAFDPDGRDPGRRPLPEGQRRARRLGCARSSPTTTPPGTSPRSRRCAERYRGAPIGVGGRTARLRDLAGGSGAGRAGWQPVPGTQRRLRPAHRRPTSCDPAALQAGARRLLRARRPRTARRRASARPRRSTSSPGRGRQLGARRPGRARLRLARRAAARRAAPASCRARFASSATTAIRDTATPRTSARARRTLHLSWQHTPAAPGSPAARVQTLLGPDRRTAPMITPDL